MTLPNYFTLIRIILTPLFFTALVSYESGKEHYRWIAFGVFIAAVFSDALDGFLARVLKQKSNLGRIMDPLADKLLLVSGYVGLLYVEALPLHPPLWITVTIVFRDMVLLVGLLIIFLISGQLPVQPNLLGKATTVCQMAVLVTVLLQWPISVFLWNLAALFTIASCVVYVFRELNQLNGSAS